MTIKHTMTVMNMMITTCTINKNIIIMTNQHTINATNIMDMKITTYTKENI